MAERVGSQERDREVFADGQAGSQADGWIEERDDVHDDAGQLERGEE